MSDIEKANAEQQVVSTKYGADNKTSWEDLSLLGYPIMEVYRKCNASRNNTMNGFKDLYLNTGLASDYQWWSYNTTIGNPYITGSRPQSKSVQRTTWSYDNTGNNQPYITDVTESWRETSSATLMNSSSVSLTLNASITIMDVASTGFNLTISKDSSESKTSDKSYDLSHTWKMEVGPGETMSLIRTITYTNEITEYTQDVGLANGSRVGTNGEKYDGHWHWAFDLNPLLGSPRGHWTLQGSSEIVTYSYAVKRTTPDGVFLSPLHTNLPDKDDPAFAHVPAAVLAKMTEIKIAAAEVIASESKVVMVPSPNKSPSGVRLLGM